MQVYKVLLNGQIVESTKPGIYAGNAPRKIFGLPTCESGRVKMKKENRRWFLTLEDVVKAGYRPCKFCRPIDEKDFKRIKNLVPYKTLEEFYNRDSF